MEVQTKISKVWRQRMLLLTLFAAGSGCWFFYDGLVGYPKFNAREIEKLKVFGAKFEELRSKGEAKNPQDQTMRAAWAEIIKERGWAEAYPKTPHTPEKVDEQLRIGGVGVLLCFAAIIYWAYSEQRNIRSEGDTIISPSGKKVKYDSIRAVDKRKWDSKGIAIAEYVDDLGPGKLVIDDYKYEGAIKILDEVERRLALSSPPNAASEQATGATG